MGRPGGRVARRKHCTSRVGFSHRVKREETMVRRGFPPTRCPRSGISQAGADDVLISGTQAWFKQRFDGILLGRKD